MTRALLSNLCGLVAVAALPAPARAADAMPAPLVEPAPDRFALAWVRAPGAEHCPSSQELYALLEDTVGSVLVTPTSATVLIDGIVAPEPSGPGHRVLIRATSADGAPVGERRLESAEPDCKTITRSALLALAVLINPDAVAQGLPARVEQAILAEPAREPERGDIPPPPQPSIAPSPDLPAERQADGKASEPLEVLDYGLSAYLAANVELTPSPMLGLALAFHAPLYDAWALEVAGAFFPAVDVTISGPYATGTIGFAAAELAPEVCRRVRAAHSFELLPCAGGVVGLRFVSASIKGFPGANRAYFGPLASLDLAWYPTSFGFIGARVQGAFLPQADRFVYTDHDGSEKVLFDPKPVAAYAGLGAGAAW